MQPLRLLPLTLLFLAPATVGPGVEAQEGEVTGEVICVSMITPDVTGPLVYASVSTEVSVALQAYYSPYAHGSFNGSPVSDGQFNSTPGGAASYSLSVTHGVSIILPARQTDHLYPDLAGFSGSEVAAHQGVTVEGYGTPVYVANANIDVAIVTDEVDGNGPRVDSIGPNGVPLGDSGTMLIKGLNLTAAGTDLNPTLAVTPQGKGMGAGLWFVGAPTVDSDSALEVQYGVGTDASFVGNYAVTVTTTAGTSKELVIVKVGDPTPVIQSVRPGPPGHWQAANSPLTVTIVGTGFGASPQLSIVGGGVTSASITRQSSDLNTLTASVTISPNTTGGTAAIRVTSQGYGGIGGNSFVQSQAGQSVVSNEVDVAVDPVPVVPPAPTIVWGKGPAACQDPNNPNLALTQQNVLVGQQITITGCVPQSQGGGEAQASQTVSESWNPALPTGVVVGGYNASAASGSIIRPTPTNKCGVDANCDFAPFYAVDPGLRQLTFSYSVAGGAGPATATVTLNFEGPEGVTVKTVVSDVDVIDHWDRYDAPVLAFGVANEAGVTFTARSSNLRGGAYQWIQLIWDDHQIYLDATGLHDQGNSVSAPPALDHWLPYGRDSDGSPTGTVTTTNVQDDTADDTPTITLLPNRGENVRWFSAQMYLMWIPPLDARCSSGPACTIQVPMGSASWGAVGDAVNSLVPLMPYYTSLGPNYLRWLRGCRRITPGPFSPTNIHPEWSTRF